MYPEKQEPDVKVSGLKALKEINQPLTNPKIKTSNGYFQINGTIESGHYIEYFGGNSVSVFDESWKKVEEIPVTKNNYRVQKGKASISVESKQEGPRPWLGVQFMTRGESIFVKRNKSKE